MEFGWRERRMSIRRRSGKSKRKSSRMKARREEETFVRLFSSPLVTRCLSCSSAARLVHLEVTTDALQLVYCHTPTLVQNQLHGLRAHTDEETQTSCVCNISLKPSLSHFLFIFYNLYFYFPSYNNNDDVILGCSLHVNHTPTVCVLPSHR